MIDIKLQYINNFRANIQLAKMAKNIFCLAALIIASACSTVVTISPQDGFQARSLEEFGLYAENVFRRQSKANIKIIMYLIDYESGNEGPEYEKLMAAEEKITHACKNLNNLVIRKVEKQQTANFLERYLYANSIGKCDHATRDIEGLLQQL